MSADISKQIRSELKAVGISSRQVGVQSDSNGARIKVKDFAVDFNLVKQLAKKFESIRYCQYSGEVLSGGNTYISVSYDWEAEKAVKSSQEYQDHLNWVLDKLSILDSKTSTGIELVEGFKVYNFQNGGGGYQVEASYSDRPWIGFHSKTDVAFELFVRLKQKQLKPRQ